MVQTKQLIDAKTVMAFRKLTDLPVLECKAVLIAAGGDFEQALRWLRKESLARYPVEPEPDHVVVTRPTVDR